MSNSHLDQHLTAFLFVVFFPPLETKTHDLSTAVSQSKQCENESINFEMEMEIQFKGFRRRIYFMCS